MKFRRPRASIDPDALTRARVWFNRAVYLYAGLTFVAGLTVLVWLVRNDLVGALLSRANTFAGIDDELMVAAPEVAWRGLIQKLFGSPAETMRLDIPYKSVLQLERDRLVKLGRLPGEAPLGYAGGKLEFRGEGHKIKLRIKGDRKMHFEDPAAASYRVDMRGEGRLLGMEEFNLQKPITRNYSHEWVFHQLIVRSGMIAPRYEFVRLTVNGRDQGLYAVEESFGKELVERFARRDGPIFSIDENQSNVYPRYEAYSQARWERTAPEVLKAAYSVLNNFHEGDEAVSRHYDLARWARYFAVADLTSAYHATSQKSVKYYYNPVNAKIEPISFDAHLGAGLFADFLIVDFLYEAPGCEWLCAEAPYFLRFLREAGGAPRKAFLDAYLAHLYRITRPEYLDTFFAETEDELSLINDRIYADVSRTDAVFHAGLALFHFDRAAYRERSAYVRNRLESANEAAVVLSKEGSGLVVRNRADRMPVRLVVSDPGGRLVADTYVDTAIELTAREAADLTVELVQPNGGRTPLHQVYEYEFQRESLPKVTSDFRRLESFEAVTIAAGVGRPVRDSVVLSDDLVVQAGERLVLSPGQELVLEDDAILYVEGEFELRGDSHQPVRVRAKSGGAIVVDGGVLRATHADFARLTTPNMPSRVLLSGLTLHEATAVLDEVRIVDSVAEDAVNFIASRVDIGALTVVGARSDAIDSDFSTVTFRVIDCQRIRNDCLDTSGSDVEGGSIVAAHIGDKLLSAGERSSVSVSSVQGTQIEIGVVSKDASKVAVERVDLEATRLGAAVFVKKREYGGADLQVADFVLRDFETPYLVDADSKALINSRTIRDNADEEVVNLLYGNLFGIETVR